MNEEEFRASVREKMSKSMNEGLNPLIPKVVDIIASAYQYIRFIPYIQAAFYGGRAAGTNYGAFSL